MPSPRSACPVILGLLALLSPALAQHPQGGPPPALVEVTEVERGRIAPTAVYVGTVTYPEVSSVAAEVEGRVATVRFDDGQQVKRGEPLVILDAELLSKEIESVAASREQAKTEAQKAGLDAERYRRLFEEKAVSQQEYENFLYQQRSLAERVKSLTAQLAALKVQLSKKTVLSPLAGVILERKVDPGEWLDAGTVVANLARNDEIDILVNVPEELTALLQRGRAIRFETSSGEGTGAVHAVVPQGDLRTRTFPVKIRARNDLNLLQGMEARVHLPMGSETESFIVPRDALVSQMGQTSIFLVNEGSAKQVSVEVSSYQGLKVGVRGEGLTEGARVVVKGNERLRPGQPVQIIPASK